MPEPQKERALNVLVEALAVLTIYALAVAWIRPSGNFPLNDDTYFGLPAIEFARTGHFHLTIAPHSLRAQVLWGALFVRLFGPTFEALRAASIVSMGIAVVMFHATLRRLPIAPRVRLLATIAFAFHPLLFWSSFTFMTETHFVCASVIAMYFFLRGFQEERLPFLLCAGAAVAVSWWIRQTGIMTAIPPLVMLLVFREKVATQWKRAAVVCAIPLVLFLGIYCVRPGWLMGSSREFFSLVHMWRETTFRLPEQVSLVRHYIFYTLLNTALFLAPLVLLSARAVFRRYSRGERIVVAAIVMFVGYGVAELLHGGSPMPFYGTRPCCDLLYGSIFSNFGLGPPTAAGGFDPQFGYPFGLSYAGQVILTILAGVLAVIAAVRLFFAVHDAVANQRDNVRLRDGAPASSPAGLAASPPPLAQDFGRRDGAQPAGETPAFHTSAPMRRDAGLLLAIGYVVAHTAALCASAAYFDRYALSSAWPVAIALAVITPNTRGAWKSAIAVMLLIAVFDVLAVDEYFAWQRARWTAWRDLQGRGVSFREIDAGSEPFDLTERAYADDIHARRRMSFGPGLRRFSVAFQPLPGMRIIGRYPFRGWLGLHNGTIFVLERISEISSTAAHG